MEDISGLRRLDATGMAHEESNAQVLLELPDLHPKRGLRDAQLLSGARHIAGLDHTDKIFELTQVHVGFISIARSVGEILSVMKLSLQALSK
jgi:hypothetical protein